MTHNKDHNTEEQGQVGQAGGAGEGGNETESTPVPGNGNEVDVPNPNAPDPNEGFMTAENNFGDGGKNYSGVESFENEGGASSGSDGQGDETNK